MAELSGDTSGDTGVRFGAATSIANVSAVLSVLSASGFMLMCVLFSCIVTEIHACCRVCKKDILDCFLVQMLKYCWH